MMIPNRREPTSIGVSLKRPASSPRPTPTTTATMNAAIVSSRVAEPLSTMIDVTVRLSVSDSPISRVTTFPTYSTYCCGIGLSYPAASRRCSSSSAGRRAPSAEVIGSPGATRMSRKTIVRRMSTVGTARAMRVRMYVRREVPCELMPLPPYPPEGRDDHTTGAPQRRPCGATQLRLVALGQEPVAEDERGVERLLDALDAIRHAGDLIRLPDRDRRHVLGADLLDLVE